MAEHGGNIEKLAQQLNVEKNQLIDFSANINPHGIPKNVEKKLIETIKDLEHYPDVNYTVAKKAIASLENVTSEQVIVGNGAVQLFFELAIILKPKQVLLLAPTFLEYEEAFLRSDTTILYYQLQEEEHFDVNLSRYLLQMELLNKGDVIVLCNPNNPTGGLLRIEQVIQIVEKAKKLNVFVILDEAFIDFVANEKLYTFVPFLKDYANVCVIKSLTKFFAIPGLRIGYALTYQQLLLDKSKRFIPPWSVNAFASAVVPLLFDNQQYFEQTKEWIVIEKDYLYKQLQQFEQLLIKEPSVNYIFFKCQLPINLREKLYAYNILIRSCSNYPTLNHSYYRVAVKNRADNNKLISALQEIFKETGHLYEKTNL